MKYFMPTAVRVKIASEFDTGDDHNSEQWNQAWKKRKTFSKRKRELEDINILASGANWSLKIYRNF